MHLLLRGDAEVMAGEEGYLQTNVKETRTFGVV